MYSDQLVYKVVIWVFFGISLWTEKVGLNIYIIQVWILDIIRSVYTFSRTITLITVQSPSLGLWHHFFHEETASCSPICNKCWSCLCIPLHCWWRFGMPYRLWDFFYSLTFFLGLQMLVQKLWSVLPIEIELPESLIVFQKTEDAPDQQSLCLLPTLYW